MNEKIIDMFVMTLVDEIDLRPLHLNFNFFYYSFTPVSIADESAQLVLGV